MYDPIKMFQNRQATNRNHEIRIHNAMFIVFHFGFWILDFGFWIFGFWILDFGFWILDFGLFVTSDNIVREGSRENKKTWPLFFPCLALAPTTFTTPSTRPGFDHSTSSRTTSVSAW